MNPNARILYIPHGGGPLPLLEMGRKSHQAMIDFLQQIGRELKKPQAILVISAHWEADLPTIISSEKPSLLYDYYGFTPESYNITYPAAGHPELASQVHHLLKAHNIESKLDAHRQFDHGLFIPLKLMYPDADIPCIQLSLVAGLDPKQHIEIGKALTALQDEDVLIIGSGFSFHNIHALMDTQYSEVINEQNEAFHNWLIDVCTNSDLSEVEREQKLIEWDAAPFAHICHPREEHLMPLHVCSGLSKNKAAQLIFDADISGKRTCAFAW
ncbi:class III extradiol ring-cleavage dioxygenase [Candidatus Albibeggiatoa sp. nov. NOAA]|uniref:DODA-type extradiol aromatic ring-opening family dioxygenase n=1 Tax=Candidatus Albibeggiatoa sp. nov. NOAA TaxID=3162724 RepID=UPI0032FCF124|nr:dioxygenase [Thiotrichaceae bacterium]